MNDNYAPLYLIPSTLGETEPLEVLPLPIKGAIEKIDHYIVENEKTARHFIKKISPRKSQPSLKISLLNKFTEPGDIGSFLDPCMEGHPVGVLSEAGCPGIADPGADVVRLAHHKGIRVIPLVGPSSIVLAMMASGFNGQNFAFKGYLPIDQQERRAAIKSAERISKEASQSQVFIETPYRNDKLLKELLKTLNKNTRLCVAADLTLPTEYIRSLAVAEWNSQNPELHKRPAIFIIQA